ncbi:MAG: hypothetical protein NVS3B9_5280 [Candidatus Doudnabacteria bacterium]
MPQGKVLGIRFLRLLPLPAAFVNSNVITIANFYDRLDIAAKLGNVNIEDRSAVLNQLVDNKITDIISADKNLLPTDQEITRAYNDVQRNTNKQDLGLAIGLSESQFKKQILIPDLQKIKLQIWLAGNTKQNADTYKNLEEAKKKLIAGKPFDDIAAMYSDDAKSAKMGGDLGFISYDDIVPEIYDVLGQFTDKDAHVLTSRFGIHIIEVVGKDNNGPSYSPRYHVKQIFMQTADYKKWFVRQKDLYSVLKLVH